MRALTVVLTLLLFAIWCLLAQANGQDDYEMLKAAANGETEKVINYFVNKRVSMGTKNNNGVSAIIFAANNGHSDLVSRLAEIGANINDRSNNGRTPLIWASFWGHESVVKSLLQLGAEKELTDKDGLTALMVASWNGHNQVLKLLIESGCEITTKNSFNGTALSMAQSKGHTEIVEILKPYFPHEEHMTPLQAIAANAIDCWQYIFNFVKRVTLFTLGPTKELDAPDQTTSGVEQANKSEL